MTPTIRSFHLSLLLACAAALASCATAPCTPGCDGRACGYDDCGNSCGACPAGSICSGVNECVACAPACDGLHCGPDDCGGSCGTCPPGQTCSRGACAVPCVPDCQGKQCGSDGCTGSCGACNNGFTCVSGACGMSPSSEWAITVTTGMLFTGTYYPTEEASVCLTLDGAMICTPPAGAPIPSWNFTFPATTLTSLETGFTAEMAYDGVILIAPGYICPPTTIQLTPANFASHTFSGGCANGTFEATLKPQ